jgi:NADPH2:quinone reductase
VRAIVVDRWTEPSELEVREASEPKSRPGSVVVDVKAAGCNFFDILIVRGQYQVKPPFPFTPGAELAGIVSEVGEGVEKISVGDRVFCGSSSGAYAERAEVPAAAVRPVPEGMSFEEAAAFPIVYPTAYAGLVHRGRLLVGETLLVHAAAGGVGLAAVQVGKALGTRVIATAGGAEKLEVARQAGADVCIDYRAEDWVARVNEETGGRGADVIYDSVGGDVFDGSLKCIAWDGRLVVIGFAGGRIPEVRANRILLKNIAVTGLHWGAYAINDPEGVEQTFDALDALYRDGAVKPVIWRTFSLEEVPAALEALGSRRTWGKLIVKP